MQYSDIQRTMLLPVLPPRQRELTTPHLTSLHLTPGCHITTGCFPVCCHVLCFMLISTLDSNLQVLISKQSRRQNNRQLINCCIKIPGARDWAVELGSYPADYWAHNRSDRKYLRLSENSVRTQQLLTLAGAPRSGQNFTRKYKKWTKRIP